MSFLEQLKQSADRNNSIVCMGLDPKLDVLPENFQRIGNFYSYLEELIDEMKTQKVFPGAFKPNQGFYIAHDKPRAGSFNGSIALSYVMDLLENEFPGTPIILDFKRGDIAKSSENYAIEGFNNWKADAVTVAPYMGTDSVMPFANYCNEKQGKGVYVLNRTSNPGAKDFQSNVMELNDSNLLFPTFEVVSHKIIEWAAGNPGVGAVVGATAPEELSDIAQLYAGKDIPMLIPGVGSQGGDGEEVATRLCDVGYNLALARINSSSGLTHPWKKAPAPKEFAKVCVDELNKLNEQIAYK